MKKFFINSLIIFTILGILFSPFSTFEVHAADDGILDYTTEELSNGACDIFSFSITRCMSSFIPAITETVMRISGLFLWFSGQILDNSISGTVHFKEFLSHMPVVDIGWVIFRDIANILFIFALLYIAISTILGLNTGSTKRMLATLVIMALLINFSLFITKVVIDSANIVTIHFYNLILESPQRTGGEAAKANLSAAFMNGLKLSSLYKTSDVGKISSPEEQARTGNDNQAKVLNMGNLLVITIAGTFLILVTAFVFLATSMMFLGRSIALMVIMILSPLAFAAMILPGLSGRVGQWWKALIGQSFFAPAFMILAYVVVATINSPAFKNYLSDASYAQVFTTGGGFEILINFVVLIGLIYSCLAVAVSLGGKTTDFGMSIAKMAREKVIAGGSWAGGRAFTSVLREGGIRLPGIRYNDKAGKLTLGGVGMVKAEKRSVSNLWTGVEFKKFNEKTGYGKNKKISARELNEKMAESRFWSGSIGSAVRENTIGALVNKKFAGRSAEEGYARDKDLTERRDRIDKRQGILETIKTATGSKEEKGTIKYHEKIVSDEEAKIDEAKAKLKEENAKPVAQRNRQLITDLETKIKASEEVIKNQQLPLEELQDKVERAMIGLSPDEFVKYMSEESLKDETVMKYATVAQIKALMKDTSKGYSFTDKNEMLSKHFSEITDEVNKVQSQMEGYYKDYNKFVEDYNKWEADLAAGTATMDDKPKEPVKPRLNDRIYDNLRAMTSEHLSLLNTLPKKKKGPDGKDVDDDIFAKEAFSTALRWGQVSDVMKSDAYGRRVKDDVRVGKDSNLQEARYLAYGIDTSLPKEEKERLVAERSAAYKKNKNWNDVLAKIPAQEHAIATTRNKLAQEKIKEHIKGRSAKEVGLAKGRFKKDPMINSYFDSGILKQMNSGDKDIDDNRQIAESLLKDYQNNALTPQGFKSIQWMVTDRDGKNFYNQDLPSGMRWPTEDEIKNHPMNPNGPNYVPPPQPNTSTGGNNPNQGGGGNAGGGGGGNPNPGTGGGTPPPPPNPRRGGPRGGGQGGNRPRGGGGNTGGQNPPQGQGGQPTVNIGGGGGTTSSGAGTP